MKVSVALVLVGLVGTAIIIVEARSQPTVMEICVDDEVRERVRNSMLDGLDAALKEHTKHMFDVWLKDDTEQPRRAINGMQAGIRTYVRSRAAALRWNPPACIKEGKQR